MKQVNMKRSVEFHWLSGQRSATNSWGICGVKFGRSQRENQSGSFSVQQLALIEARRVCRSNSVKWALRLTRDTPVTDGSYANFKQNKGRSFRTRILSKKVYIRGKELLCLINFTSKLVRSNLRLLSSIWVDLCHDRFT